MTALLGVGEEVIVVASVLLVVFIAFLVHLYLTNQTIMDYHTGQGDGSPRLPSGRLRSSPVDCPICMDQVAFAGETNCGHVFCGECILEVYHRGVGQNLLSAPACPYCRQRITTILPYFSLEERNAADLAEVEKRNKVSNEIAAYNRRFSGEPRSYMEQLRDLPMFLRHLWSALWSADGIHLMFRFRIFVLFVGAFLYLALPFDILPEFAFGIVGLLDDAIVTLLLVMYAVNVFRNAIAGGE